MTVHDDLATLRDHHECEGPGCVACVTTDRVEAEVARLRDGLRCIADQQTKTVEWLRAHGIVFDDLDDHWQKVAFSIYTDLCEVDAWAHDLLDEGIDGKSRALLADQDGAVTRIDMNDLTISPRVQREDGAA